MKITDLLFKTTVVLSFLSLLACSPGLGSSLRVNPLIIEAPKNSADLYWDTAHLKIRVMPFVDGRARLEIAEIDSRVIPAASDVPTSVMFGMEDLLRSHGFRIGDFEPNAVIEGTIEKWFVKITPAFPLTKILGEAGVQLKVTGRTSYSARYYGSIQKQHPWPGESTIEETLHQALVYAFEEALEDPMFIQALGLNPR